MPLLALILGLSLLAAACDSNGDGSPPAGAPIATSLAIASPTTVTTPEDETAALDVSLRDFAIDVTPAAIPAGLAEFNVRNDGDVVHQFLVIRSDQPADALPLTDSGFEVDVDQLDVVARAQSVAGDESIVRAETVRFDTELSAGRYVLICDVPGHYGSGMAATLSVQ